MPGHVAPPQTHQSEVTQYLLDTINTLVTNIQSLNERVAHLESQIIDLNSQHADPPTAGSKPVDEHTSLLAFKMNDHTKLQSELVSQSPLLDLQQKAHLLYPAHQSPR